MIKHIVAWRIKEGIDKQTAAENIKRELESLKDKIDVLKFIQVGINFNDSDVSSDIVLVSDFDTKEALSIYQEHPEHKRVGAEFVRPNVCERRVCDYEY